MPDKCNIWFLPHLWNCLNNLKFKFIIWAWIWAILYGLNISSWDEIIENWFSELKVKKVSALEEIISNNIFQKRNKLKVNLSCRKVTIRIEQIPCFRRKPNFEHYIIKNRKVQHWGSWKCNWLQRKMILCLLPRHQVCLNSRIMLR